MNTTQLTFTRFIAAFFIVFLHFGGDLFTTDNNFIKIFRNHLYLGVDYFYVLSGFVMMLAYGKNKSINFFNYMQNRIARIYPLHVFSLLLTILISLIISFNYLKFWNFSIIDFILNSFLLQSWFPTSALNFNSPSWSVYTEMFFYICFPFLLNNFINKFTQKTVISVFIIFWLICQMGMNLFYFSKYYDGYESLSRYFLYYNPFLHLNSFCIGLTFGILFNKHKKSAYKNYDLKIIAVFIFCSILVYFFHNLFMHNGLLAIPFGLMIYWIASNDGKLTQLFRHRWLIHLGEISFAVYLLQTPIFLATKKNIFNIRNRSSIFYVFSWIYPSLN